MSKRVFGLYKHVDTLLAGTKKIKEKGLEYELITPIPIIHEMEHEFGERHNYMKYFTLFGGFIGFFAGAVLALGTAWLYILPRAGRPLFSITPTLLISYETTILFGVIFSLATFFIFSKLPNLKFETSFYDPRVNEDDFAILIEGVEDGDFEEVKSILEAAGAHEVTRVEDDK